MSPEIAPEMAERLSKTPYASALVGVQPLHESNSPLPTQTQNANGYNPLANLDPNDAGINLEKMFANLKQGR